MPRSMRKFTIEKPKPFPLFNDKGLLCDTKTGYARVLPNLTLARNMAAKAEADGYVCHAFKDCRVSMEAMF